MADLVAEIHRKEAADKVLEKLVKNTVNDEKAPGAVPKLEDKGREVMKLTVVEIESVLFSVYYISMDGSKLRKADYVRALEKEMSTNILNPNQPRRWHLLPHPLPPLPWLQSRTSPPTWASRTSLTRSPGQKPRNSSTFVYATPRIGRTNPRNSPQRISMLPQTSSGRRLLPITASLLCLTSLSKNIDLMAKDLK